MWNFWTLAFYVLRTQWTQNPADNHHQASWQQVQNQADGYHWAIHHQSKDTADTDHEAIHDKGKTLSTVPSPSPSNTVAFNQGIIVNDSLFLLFYLVE